MKEVRFHGRGGQGAALAAEILAGALLRDGSYAAAFPMFGFERRGAPVTSFLRFDRTPVRERTQVYTPDCLVVLDPGLGRTGAIYEGLRPGGALVINAMELPALPPSVSLGLAGGVRATVIAREELGRPAANTAMLGAFARVTGWVSLAALLDVLPDYFQAETLTANRRAAERGFHESVLLELSHASRPEPGVEGHVNGAEGQLEAEPRGAARVPRGASERLGGVGGHLGAPHLINRHLGAPHLMATPHIIMETAWADPETMHVIPTGEWRSHRPVTRQARCSHCGLCFLLCPAGSMHDRGSHFDADLAFCKGCGTCARVCPSAAILMVEEAKA